MRATNQHMSLAIAEAEAAAARGEVPVGAVLVDGETGEIISVAGNRVEETCDPSAHAEVLALRDGGKRLGSPRLTVCDLYVTLEPCPMCAQVIAFARLRRLYFGAYDPKAGGVEHGPRVFEQSGCNHRPEIYGGIDETECSRLLSNFFQNKR